MARIRGYLVTALATAAVILLFGMTTPQGRAAATAISAVFVVNPPTHPVPVAVQGTAAISGSVTVANLGDTAPSHPVQEPLSFSFAQDPATEVVTYTVPQGQRLVIEYISLAATRPLLNAVVTTVVHGTSVSYPLPTSATGNAFAQQVRLYADGGTTVTVAVTGAEFASVTGGLSGYLAPAGS